MMFYYICQESHMACVKHCDWQVADSALLIEAVQAENLNCIEHLLETSHIITVLRKALETALGNDSKSLEVITLLLKAGAYTPLTNLMYGFLRKHKTDGLFCREFLQITCQTAKTGILNCSAQSYSLFGTLMNIFSNNSISIPNGQDIDNPYLIQDWTAHSIVKYLLHSGANAETLWDPLFELRPPSLAVYGEEQSIEGYIPIGILSICLRTATGSSVPRKIHRLFIRYLSENQSPGYTQFQLSNEKIYKFILLLYWTGVDLDIYTRRNCELFNSLRQVQCLCLEYKHNPKSLQLCCRLVLQYQLQGPNLLYALDNLSIPKNVKETIVLENADEVRQLECTN